MQPGTLVKVGIGILAFREEAMSEAQKFDPTDDVLRAIGTVVMAFGLLEDAFELAFRAVIPLSSGNSEIIRNGVEFGGRVNIFEAAYKESRHSVTVWLRQAGYEPPRIERRRTRRQRLSMIL